MQKLERQKSDTAAKPPPYKPLNPMEDIFNTNAVHIPGGDKGLEPNFPFPPKQPTDPTLPAHDLATGNFIRKVRRSDVEEYILNIERIRWLNDPVGTTNAWAYKRWQILTTRTSLIESFSIFTNQCPKTVCVGL